MTEGDDGRSSGVPCSEAAEGCCCNYCRRGRRHGPLPRCSTTVSCVFVYTEVFWLLAVFDIKVFVLLLLLFVCLFVCCLLTSVVFGFPFVASV